MLLKAACETTEIILGMISSMQFTLWERVLNFGGAGRKGDKVNFQNTAHTIYVHFKNVMTVKSSFIFSLHLWTVWTVSTPSIYCNLCLNGMFHCRIP